MIGPASLQTLLQKLYSNKNILQECLAKYAGQATLPLLNQIADYDQTIAQELAAEELETALSGLNLVIRGMVAIGNRSRDQLISEFPYCGLGHFGPDNGHDFFGRETFVSWLVRRVQQQSFTASTSSIHNYRGIELFRSRVVILDHT